MTVPPPRDFDADPPADEDVARLSEYLDARAGGAYPRVAGNDPLAVAVAGQLADPATWSEPPPELRAAVLARALGSAPAPAAADPPLAEVRPLHRRQTRWAVPAAAAAAVVLVVGTLAVDHAVRDDGTNGPLGRTYSAAGTPLSHGGSAKLTVASAPGGFSFLVALHHFPPAAPGTYYSAWLKGPRGSVPLGSFHARKAGDPIKLWSGVDPKDYPTFTVTVQQEGQSPLPSGRLVLKAALH